MRGLKVRSDPMGIGRLMPGAARAQNLPLAGNSKPATTSELWYEKASASGEEDRSRLEELQEGPRKFFADTTQWWNNRQTKLTRHRSNFRQKEFEFPLWPNNQCNPARVDWQLARMDIALKTTSKARSTRGQGPQNSRAGEGHMDVEACRRLCEDGLISDAVDELDLLLQRGCHVPSKIFSCVLKRCIQDKNLAWGTRVHALTVRTGLGGDPFLATQLISLYASHGQLDEAIKVFNKVSVPNAYNWASIISAYARDGDAAHAAEAVRLYQQMCEMTTVKYDDRLYSAVLNACASAKDLAAGKQIHDQILASSGKIDKFVEAGLVNMYVKCGSLENARRVFDNLSVKNVVIWTAMIAGYAQHGMAQKALDLHKIMQHEGLSSPNCVTYSCLLQACASIGVAALDEGKHFHAEIAEQGLLQSTILSNSLLNMYVKCGDLNTARSLFSMLSERNIVTWNTLIVGYTQQGRGLEALYLYRSMIQEGLTSPDCVTYTCLLQACASLGVTALDEGKQLHGKIKDEGLQEHVVVGNGLVNMYAKCGSIDNARKLFDKLLNRNVVTWTTMIAGYVQQGMGHEALDLYRGMQQDGLSPPNEFTYACLLQACANIGVTALDQGKQLHGDLRKQGLREDMVLGGSLVNMYAKCNSLQDARSLFENLLEKNVATWNAMIAGYAQQGKGHEALRLYSNMQQEGLTPDSVTFVSLLQACASVGVEALDEGKQLHADIKERGLQDEVIIGSSLINMYAKCGNLGDARRLFDKLPRRNVVVWNAMFAGYAQQGTGQEAFSLYRTMQQEGLVPNSVTFVCLLQACVTLGVEALAQGQQLHAHIDEQGLEKDVVLGGSLVNMYVKCGSLEDAHVVFDKLPTKGVVTWTAMIAGYVQQGMCQEALDLHNRLRAESLMPDPVTYACLLQACAATTSLTLGEQLHAEMKERGIEADGNLGAALVNMYAKCGRMYDAHQVFDSLSEKNIDVWGALVSGYARQGNSQCVFDLLDRMRLEGMSPNEVTFLSVLTVCSHVGLVDKGWEYFEAMRLNYGIIATMEHYRCMVDLLGRAGHLDEALRMAQTMPFPPGGVVWRTLLSACQKWKNVDIGQQAFKGAMSVDEEDAASYMLMSNIYASTEMWEAAKELQGRRVKLAVRKMPGQSWWTDTMGVVHTFTAQGNEHLESEVSMQGWICARQN